VTNETGIPAPEACVRLASKERLDGLVFPVGIGESHGEIVAAAYVPATREILLADDLDPSTPLARSYLVHELVHAQQFTSRAHEHVRCPGVLEADAYGTQALYLSTPGSTGGGLPSSDPGNVPECVRLLVLTDLSAP
jgi:hypothetical protein